MTYVYVHVLSKVEIANEATEAFESFIKGSNSFVFVATNVGLWLANQFNTLRAAYFCTLFPFWIKIIKAL